MQTESAQNWLFEGFCSLVMEQMVSVFLFFGRTIEEQAHKLSPALRAAERGADVIGRDNNNPPLWVFNFCVVTWCSGSLSIFFAGT